MKSQTRVVLLMLLLISSAYSLFSQGKPPAPTVQDCLGAIPVCQPIYTTTQSYTGYGNVYPEIHSNKACPLCMAGEINDVFYTFTVQNSGIFRFTLTPANPLDDYDWALFNMTNATCADLYPRATQLQVSCNSRGVRVGTNGPTGINSTLSDNKDCNGPGNTNGPAFNRDLNVVAGATYLLNISNWSPTNQSGYTLDFSGSTAQIYDNVPPHIDSIQQTISCAGSSTLYVRFSENVRCTDVENHQEKFTLTSPNGTYLVTGLTSPDCDIGGSQTTYCILQVSPPLYAGTYSLNLTGSIGDLCGNLALQQSYPFTLTELGAPVAHAGNDTTVSNGTILTLHGSATGGSGAYGWHWEPASQLNDATVQNPLTLNMGATTTFILTVNDSIFCHGHDSVTVTVTGGPLGVASTASPAVICAGDASQLLAIPTGGSGNYTYSWTSSPSGFTPNIPNPVVYPTVTTTYLVQLVDGFSTVNGSTTVTVHPKPVANAGSNISIPYGTTTTLHGNASGGMGGYSYHWTSNPSGFYSTQQNQLTSNLDMTTRFDLVVSDNTTGCNSDPSEMIVTVTGNALNVTPVSSAPAICRGKSAQLNAMAGGGSGNYSYSWASTPPGFSSNVENPIVTPLETTTYQVLVNDGYNTDTGSVAVHVNPLPLVHIGPADTTLCIFSSIRLDAGNPGSTYYWSNGSTDQSILVSTTGITYDYQTYSLQVQNSYGCVDSATIHITFAFGACLGINEKTPRSDWKIYPNPASNELYLEVGHPDKTFTISMIDNLGRVIKDKTFTATPGIPFHGLIPIADLPAGSYFFKLKSATGWDVKNIIIR
jgi:hypothetical protein